MEHTQDEPTRYSLYIKNGIFSTKVFIISPEERTNILKQLDEKKTYIQLETSSFNADLFVKIDSTDKGKIYMFEPSNKLEPELHVLN